MLTKCLSLLCLLLALLPQAEASENKQVKTDVIVIGAGAAGIAAAHELSLRHIKVIVLEARDRIGGRVWSDRRSDNQSVDLGAGWIHGVRRNPVYRLVEKQDITVTETDYDNIGWLHPPPTAISDKMIEDYIELLDDAMSDVSDSTGNISVSDALKNLMEQQPELNPALLNFVANLVIEQEYAAPLNKLSVSALEEGEVFSGEDVMFPGGYDQIFTSLIENLDIRMAQVVNRIDYTNDRVKLQTIDNKQYFADEIIVTVPLGVLQHNSIVFTPSLPDSKIQAIEALGMAVFNKVYLGFSDVFWQKERDFLALYPNNNSAESFPNYWPSMLNLYHQYGDKALLAISTGDSAIAVETLSDKQIVQRLMLVLRGKYGAHIPDPNDVRITRWQKDPYAHGAYSFMQVGATENSREMLAKPLSNRVFFAGEATHLEYPATVHGALLSGIREARKIIRYRQ